MSNYDYARIPDWSHLRERYLAAWEKRVLDDRIMAHIQNPTFGRPEPEPWMLEASADKYLDPAKLLKLATWRRTAWHWQIDLFEYRVPSYWPNVFTGSAERSRCLGRTRSGMIHSSLAWTKQIRCTSTRTTAIGGHTWRPCTTSPSTAPGTYSSRRPTSAGQPIG